MGIRGPQKTEGALRRTGWRPSCTLPGAYQDLVFAIFNRPEFEGKKTGDVFMAALEAFATEDELSQVDLP